MRNIASVPSAAAFRQTSLFNYPTPLVVSQTKFISYFFVFTFSIENKKINKNTLMYLTIFAFAKINYIKISSEQKICLKANPAQS